MNAKCKMQNAELRGLGQAENPNKFKNYGSQRYWKREWIEL